MSKSASQRHKKVPKTFCNIPDKPYFCTINPTHSTQSDMTYNRRCQETLPMKVWKKIWITLLCWQDRRRDKKICGTSLVSFPKAHSNQVHASQPSHYRVLEKIFCKSHFTEDDSILDIGCGKGRILAFFTERGHKGKLTGVELRKEVAEECRQWIKAYPNIQIIAGNVLELDLNNYTVMVMFNPFGANVLLSLLEKMEKELTHPIHLYYLSDHEYGNHINGRPGWELKHRGWVWKDGPYYLYWTPQRCSWWCYTPKNTTAATGSCIPEGSKK